MFHDAKYSDYVNNETLTIRRSLLAPKIQSGYIRAAQFSLDRLTGFTPSLVYEGSFTNGISGTGTSDNPLTFVVPQVEPLTKYSVQEGTAATYNDTYILTQGLVDVGSSPDANTLQATTSHPTNKIYFCMCVGSVSSTATGSVSNVHVYAFPTGGSLSVISGTVTGGSWTIDADQSRTNRPKPLPHIFTFVPDSTISAGTALAFGFTCNITTTNLGITEKAYFSIDFNIFSEVSAS